LGLSAGSNFGSPAGWRTEGALEATVHANPVEGLEFNRTWTASPWTRKMSEPLSGSSRMKPRGATLSFTVTRTRKRPAG
jgi:hypothetical protein